MTGQPLFENLNDRIRRIVREELGDANGLRPDDYRRLFTDIGSGRCSSRDFSDDMQSAIARLGWPASDRRCPDAC